MINVFQISSKLDDEYLIIKGKEVTWYRPVNLYDILALKQQYPNSKLIVGNTEVGKTLFNIKYTV